MLNIYVYTCCLYILLLVMLTETDFLLQLELALAPSHRSTPTSLCRHGSFLSSNTMIFLSYATCCFPFSLSLPLSLQQHSTSFQLHLLYQEKQSFSPPSCSAHVPPSSRRLQLFLLFIPSSSSPSLYLCHSLH